MGAGRMSAGTWLHLLGGEGEERLPQGAAPKNIALRRTEGSQSLGVHVGMPCFFIAGRPQESSTFAGLRVPISARTSAGSTA